MGISVVDSSRKDVDTIISSLGEVLQEIRDGKATTA